MARPARPGAPFLGPLLARGGGLLPGPGAGETWAEDVAYGYAFVIRHQESGFIYVHFTWLGDVAEVVVS